MRQLSKSERRMQLPPDQECRRGEAATRKHPADNRLREIVRGRICADGHAEIAGRAGQGRPQQQARTGTGAGRIHALDGIIQRLYEDNVSGKISDERFAKLSAGYEEEQRTLECRVAELQSLIDAETKRAANVNGFLAVVRKYTDIQELNAEIIREFVEMVYVHQAEKKDGKKLQRVRIVWNFIGELPMSAAPEKDKSA